MDKIPTPKPSSAAQRGTDVHLFCHDFYNHVSISGSHFIVEPKWLDEQLELLTDEARPFVENFIKFEKERWKVCVEHSPNNPAKYFFPVIKEQKITNLGIEMVGIVDRVDLNFDDKTYTVVDYKTERFDNRSWKLTEHRREMAFYKKLISNSNLLKGEVTHFCIYYPRSNDVWNEKFNGRTLSSLEEKLKDVRQKIERKEFPVCVSYYCRFCEMNNRCEFE